MIFEYSKTDGLPGAMALRTLTERMVAAWTKVENERKESIGRGIVRGINEFADPALVTREFAPRVQIMGSLRNCEHGRLFASSLILYPVPSHSLLPLLCSALLLLAISALSL